jgi:3-deoxy-D-manno-octulosonic-acid transferase
VVSLPIRTVTDGNLIFHRRGLRIGLIGNRGELMPRRDRFASGEVQPGTRRGGYLRPGKSASVPGRIEGGRGGGLSRSGPAVLFRSMSTLSGAYDLSLRFARQLSPLFARGSSKLAMGIRGRQHALVELTDWAVAHRERERPLVWLHAPSVGEGLQAMATLAALKRERPDLQAVYTYFSPSALPLARRMPADVSAFLPWDVHAEMETLIEALSPDLIAFTKTEVWPGVAAAAFGHGVPVVLVAATLPPGAGRLRAPARVLLRSTFRQLERVLAISPEDGERFLRLDVRQERIDVTGDPAVDSAWQRVREADPAAPYLAPFRADPQPTVVAGSTWEEDEAVLLPAVGRLRSDPKGPGTGFRVIIAPHEPTDSHLARLEGELRGMGIRSARLSVVEAQASTVGCEVVLVDRVGILSHLYTVGTVAFVGGGFGTRGLHSVLEPAAAGIPSLFGPHHLNSRAAGELQERGGGVSVTGADPLLSRLRGWVGDPEQAREAGERASGYIEVHRGAAQRTAAVLSGLLPPSRSVNP